MRAMDLWGGVDLGGTKIQVVVADERFEVLGEQRVPTPTAGGPQDVADAIAGAVRDAAAAAGVEPDALSGLGVGSPGEADATAGTVAGARNLPGWEGSFPLGAALTEALGPRVAIGNDVQVATDAEAELGAGRPYGSLLGVFWGTGVGGGIVLDGRPWLGRSAAGEIGHVVVEQGGALCGCGRRGCLEAYAGRASMERRARELVDKGEKTDLFRIMEKRGRTRLTSGIWARALEHDDAMAIHLIDRAVQAMAVGIASAQNLLDVDAIILGGGLGIRLGEPYKERIGQAMLQHLFVDERPPAFHVAALGDLGGAIGAALLASRAAAPAAG
jgi:glucokinase